MEDNHVDRCVLFADIAGSTRMYGECGDDATQKLLSKCLDLMDEIVREGGGHVARRIGDELLCTFPEAEKAAMAAMRLQDVVSADSRGLFARPVRIRVGFEFGPIIETDDALYGNTVHIAARVASMAKAGQILTTKETLERLSGPLRCFTRHFDTTVMKGVAGEQQVYELLWSVPEATLANKRPPAPRPEATVSSVALEYGGRTFHVDAGHPRLEIGRDLSCDLRVEGQSVSQVHARVLWDRGRVKLEDVSTNGTVIELDAGNRVSVFRARATLLGSGMLHLGDEAVVSYRCD